MALKSLFQYINIKRRKKPTAEETLQAIQLSCNSAHEMKLLLNSIDINVNLVNERLNKAEPHIFEDKKILSFNTSEYEALCEMLNSLKIISAQGIIKTDHILLLLRML